MPSNAGLPYGPIQNPGIEDETFPPVHSFNLISALHHISGTMAITFECRHGCISENTPNTPITFENILDMELNLYDVMLEYALQNRLYWETD